jgi:hypothetical protein
MKPLFLTAFLFLSQITFGQEERKEDWETETVSNSESKLNSTNEFRKNVRIGGEFGLSSQGQNNGREIIYLLFFSLKPQITYVFNDFFEAGISTGYSYMGTFGTVNYHWFEFGPIARFYPTEGLFIQGEWNITRASFSQYGRKESGTYDNFFVGGGMRNAISETSYILYGIKFNLKKNEFTQNQIIPSAFFTFHFGL